MMKLIIAVIGIAAYLYIEEGKKFLDSYSFKITRLGFDNASSQASGYQKLFLSLEAAIINPTGFSATMNKLALAFFYNGKRISEVVKTQPVIIEPNKSTIVKFTAQVNTLSAFQSVTEAISVITSGEGIKINILGGAIFSAGTVKINETVKVL